MLWTSGDLALGSLHAHTFHVRTGPGAGGKVPFSIYSPCLAVGTDLYPEPDMGLPNLSKPESTEGRPWDSA